MNNFYSQILEVRKLRTKEYRKKTGLVIIEGYPEVRRAVEANIDIKVIYICSEIFQPQEGEFDHLPVIEVDRETFQAMAFGKRLKGILALGHPVRKTFDDLRLSDCPLIMILDNVEKPGNIGGVLRTCDGAGVDAMIVTDAKTDIYNHHVVRSSIGTVFTVPVIEAGKEEALNFLKSNLIKLAVASSRGKDIYTETDFDRPQAFVVGNEHDGVSPFWFEHADQIVSIPMKGPHTSLNVTVSASVLAYEALRQRSQKGARFAC